MSNCAPRLRLRPAQTLLGPDVVAVLKGGKSRSSGVFKVQFRKNAIGCARLAQIVPKRLAGRAVDRNRIRRIVRESFRHRQAKWTGYDCVVRLRVTFESDVGLAHTLDALFDSGP